MWNYFCVTTSPTLEEIDLSGGKNDGFWLLWGVFNKYIKQNVFMAVLRNNAKWFNVFQNTKCLCGFQKENKAYYRILFTPTKNNKVHLS